MFSTYGNIAICIRSSVSHRIDAIFRNFTPLGNDSTSAVCAEMRVPQNLKFLRAPEIVDRSDSQANLPELVTLSRPNL